MPPGGILLDIEGVVLEEGRLLPGARPALRDLRRRDLGCRFLTNTTTQPRHAIADRLRVHGIEAADGEILSPAAAAAGLLAASGARRVHLAAAVALAVEFEAFDLIDDAPDAVVLGDLHEGFTWQRLDALFRMVRDGARLIALHKNRFCRRDGRIALDLGPFVAALEYAGDVEATVVGKPAPAFFARAAADLGLDAARIVMVGDDIEADIGGALGAGMQAVQVRTGKYAPGDEARGKPVPTARIASIADLPRWLDTQP